MKAANARLEGFMDWVDSIANELTKRERMICPVSLLDLQRGCVSDELKSHLFLIHFSV